MSGKKRLDMGHQGALGGNAGGLEVNVFVPLIARNLLQAISLLAETAAHEVLRSNRHTIDGPLLLSFVVWPSADVEQALQIALLQAGASNPADLQLS